MNDKLKAFWIVLAIALLLYAIDAMVFSIARPVFSPVQTFADSLARAFIAILASAGILTYLKFAK